MSFRIISILGFIGVLILIPVQAICCPAAPTGEASRPLPKAQRLLYSLLRLGLLILALTGISAGILWDGPMRGWILMLHVAAAPLFAIGIAGIALAWADRRQYSKSPGPGEIDSWQKFLFWAMLTLALVVILSAVLPMTPLFGQDSLELLYKTHRYSSLFFVLAAVLHAVRFGATR
jgi:hypothetical protein